MKSLFLSYLILSTLIGFSKDTVQAYFDQPSTFEEIGMFGKKHFYKLRKRECYSVTASSTLEEESAKYLAKNITDNSVKTAWVEGTDSLGIGETLFFEFDKLTEFNVGIPDIIEIIPGYAKSPKTWYDNGRLLSFNMVLLNYDKEEDYPVEDFHVQLATIDGDLPMKSQFIDISSFHIQNMAVDFFKFIRIEIVDVKSGKKYNDLCISTINFYEKVDRN